MTDESPGDMMRSHDELAEMEEQYRDRKHDKIEQISEVIQDTIETTVADKPPHAEIYEVNETGETYSIRLRLDRAELLHKISETLPEEFAVYNIWNDGTISVRWNEGPTGNAQQLDTTLRGIVAESTPNDEHSPITLAWDELVQKAVDLGYDRDLVERRLHEMDDFNAVEVFEEDGETRVGPGDMFQEF